jgi:hypothetical protein
LSSSFLHFTRWLLLQSSIELAASLNVRLLSASNELLSVLASFRQTTDAVLALRRFGKRRGTRRGNDSNCIVEIPLIPTNSRFLPQIDNFCLPSDDRYHLEIIRKGDIQIEYCSDLMNPSYGFNSYYKYSDSSRCVTIRLEWPSPPHTEGLISRDLAVSGVHALLFAVLLFDGFTDFFKGFCRLITDFIHPF